MKFIHLIAFPATLYATGPTASAATAAAPSRRRRRVVPVHFGPTATPTTSEPTSSSSSMTTTTTTESSTASSSSTTTTEASTSSSTDTAATTSSTTGFPTRSVAPSNETWTLAMSPKFSFGAAQRRGYALGNAPTGTVAACPTDREYCIDTRFSDEGTCMYPSPETIKECLDDTCAAHPGNEAIFKSKKEDSYCKDWQVAPEGRVCHWTTDVFCSCPNFSIIYTNAVFVTIGDITPHGFAVAQQCKYPDNYKAKNKRELQGNNGDAGAGAQDKPLQRLGPGQRNDVGDGNASEAFSNHIVAILAACILVTVF